MLWLLLASFFGAGYTLQAEEDTTIAPSSGAEQKTAVTHLLLGDLAARKGNAADTAYYFEQLTRQHPRKDFLIQCINGALQSQNRHIADSCFERLQTLADNPELDIKAAQLQVIRSRIIALTYPPHKAAKPFIELMASFSEAEQKNIMAQTVRLLMKLHLYDRGATIFSDIIQHFDLIEYQVFYADFLRYIWQDERALTVAQKAYRLQATPLTLIEYVEALQQNNQLNQALTLLAEHQAIKGFSDTVLKARIEKINDLGDDEMRRAFLQKIVDDKIIFKHDISLETMMLYINQWIELENWETTLSLLNQIEKYLRQDTPKDTKVNFLYFKGLALTELGHQDGQALIERVRGIPRILRMEKIRKLRKKAKQLGIDGFIQKMLEQENIIRAPGDYLREARVLAEHNRHDAALYLLHTGLNFHPDEPDMLYNAAMYAIEEDRLDLLEIYLKKAIENDPKNFHAHNALGYSWADKGINLPQAKKHIDIALKYLPLSPIILDSLGWYYYRVGDYKQALSFLTRAYALQRDPEISAHLIEVLFQHPESSNSKTNREKALNLYKNTLRRIENLNNTETAKRGLKIIQEVATRFKLK